MWQRPSQYMYNMFIHWEPITLKASTRLHLKLNLQNARQKLQLSRSQAYLGFWHEVLDLRFQWRYSQLATLASESQSLKPNQARPVTAWTRKLSRAGLSLTFTGCPRQFGPVAALVVKGHRPLRPVPGMSYLQTSRQSENQHLTIHLPHKIKVGLQRGLYFLGCQGKKQSVRA